MAVNPSLHRSKHRWPTKLLASLAVGLVAVASSAVPTSAQSGLTADPAAAPERIISGKAPSSRLAKTDPSLLGLSGSAPTAVVVKLDYDAIASYSGGVAGLAATSPSVTGQRINPNSATVRAYDAYAQGVQARFVSALRSSVPSARVGTSLRVVYGGVSLVVPANKISALLALPGAVAVHRNVVNQPLTDASPEFIGATSVWDQLGSDTTAGEGVITGVLDTGAWPEHASYADIEGVDAPPAKADGTPRTCDYGDNPLPEEVAPFVCNNKLISGEAFLFFFIYF